MLSAIGICQPVIVYRDLVAVYGAGLPVAHPAQQAYIAQGKVLVYLFHAGMVGAAYLQLAYPGLLLLRVQEVGNNRIAGPDIHLVQGALREYDLLGVLGIGERERLRGKGDGAIALPVICRIDTFQLQAFHQPVGVDDHRFQGKGIYPALHQAPLSFCAPGLRHRG